VSFVIRERIAGPKIWVDEKQSWALQHLSTIHYVPLGQLQCFAVRRIVHPVALLPFPPVDVAIPPVQTGLKAEPISLELLESLVAGGNILHELCLDWWEIDTVALEALLRTTGDLRKLQVAVRAPMAHLVSVSDSWIWTDGRSAWETRSLV